MSIRLTTPDGFVFECDTAADALEVRRGLVNETTPKTRRAPKTSSLASRYPSNGSESSGLRERSRRLLESLRAVGKDGIKTEDLAIAMGVSTKSLPPQIMQLRKELKRQGFRFGDVIVRHRVYVQGRAKSIYKPGKAIDEALTRH